MSRRSSIHDSDESVRRRLVTVNQLLGAQNSGMQVTGKVALTGRITPKSQSAAGKGPATSLPQDLVMPHVSLPSSTTGPPSPRAKDWRSRVYGEPLQVRTPWGLCHYPGLHLVHLIHLWLPQLLLPVSPASRLPLLILLPLRLLLLRLPRSPPLHLQWRPPPPLLPPPRPLLRQLIRRHSS